MQKNCIDELYFNNFTEVSIIIRKQGRIRKIFSEEYFNHHRKMYMLKCSKHYNMENIILQSIWKLQ